MKEQIPKPTEAELEILQILWTNGPSTVRSVNERINDRREKDQKEVGYTTTLKLMQIMLEKGLLKRNAERRSHIYEPAVSEEATQKRLLNRFVDAAFRGSAMKMVMQALGNHRASKEEIDEIKALIKKMEEKD